MTGPHQKLRALWLARKPRREPSLVAFVAPHACADCDPEALRLWLSQTLPPWMVPAQFAVVSHLPRTPSGKVDRSALPETVSTDAPAREMVPPRTELEQRIADLFAQTLGARPQSVNDDFFVHLGGHSLVATQLVSLIRREWDIELPLRAIFESPTVAAMAECVTRARQQADSRTVIPRRRM
jgi:acyl carrier protein